MLNSFLWKEATSRPRFDCARRAGGVSLAPYASLNPEAALAFRARSGKWLCDIYCLARQRLSVLGVAGIWGGGLCTFTVPEHFYSFRRDGVTGRMASLVWLAE